MPNSTYKGQPIRYFLIDRLAAGFDTKTTCSLFRSFFDYIATDEEIMKLVDDDESRKEIEERRGQVLLEIDRTNLVGIMMRHINNLDAMAENSDDTSEKMAVLNTLQRFIESAKPKMEKQDAPKQITVTNNYTQINSNFIVDLEKDGVVKIVDRAKFNRLYGLPAPEIDLDTISAPFVKKPEKKDDPDGPIESFV